MKFDLELADIDAVEATLRTLPETIEKRVLNAACRSAATVVGREFRKRAPAKRLRKTGIRSGVSAAKALRLRTRKAKGLAVVGFLQPSSRLAHLFEFGTAPRFHRSGKSTGRMMPRPFMRPGFDAAVPEARRRFGATMRRRLDAEVTKLAASPQFKRGRRRSRRIRRK
jgi:HK97 gp10 family phage protein